MVKAEVVYTRKSFFQLPKTYNNLLFGTTLAVWGVTMLLILGIPVLSLLTGTEMPAGYTKDLIFWIAAIIFLILLRNVILPVSAYSKYHKKFGDTPMYYEFGEESFTSVQNGNGFSENISLRYDKLDKVIETKEYFLLSPRSGSAYIIARSDITEGTPDELRAILRKNMGKRYKVK